MGKRNRDGTDSAGPLPKRHKGHQDHFTVLSDELLLRILGHVSVSTLATCLRVSERLKRIAGDSQLWRAAYYNRFVLPRSSGAKRRKAAGTPTTKSRHTRTSKWLDEEDLVRRGTQTNWKRQYKIRDNWSRGTAKTSDIPVADQPPIPPILAKLSAGIVYTVDSGNGIRAWSYKDNKHLLAAKSLRTGGNACKDYQPTAFVLHKDSPSNDKQLLVVGFKNGIYSIYCYEIALRSFAHLYSHPIPSQGMITALAFASQYLLTMNESRILALYELPGLGQEGTWTDSGDPVLLSSLSSQTAWSPLSLSLRADPDVVSASIAYALPTLSGSWSTGVQELRFSPSGSIMDSRLASATSQVFVPILPGMKRAQSPTERFSLRLPSVYGQDFSKPTSLSYSHPYLLVTHSDNTLTLYMVNSTSQSLSVSPGRRLWGHTSSVFGAHIGRRGKAVSVTTRGDELRVWNLEGRGRRTSRHAHWEEDDSSVQVKPDRQHATSQNLEHLSKAISDRGNGLGLTGEYAKSDLACTRGWVGFDDENVVILREEALGGQALTVYDFT